MEGDEIIQWGENELRTDPCGLPTFQDPVEEKEDNKRH